MAEQERYATIIVVKASRQGDAELAARVADPEGGAGTFNPGVPLARASQPEGAVVAFWASWQMTWEQRAMFCTAMATPCLPPGADVRRTADEWVFEASEPGGWTAEQVLETLGFQQPALPY